MRRSFAAIFIILGLLLFLVLGPMWASGRTCLKQALDPTGKPVFRADGSPMRVADKRAQFRADLPTYKVMTAGAGSVVVGIVLLALPNRKLGRGFEVVLGERPRT